MILSRFRSRITDEALSVQPLRNLHGVMGSHIQGRRGDSHQLHRVKSDGPLLRLLFGRHICNRGVGGSFDLPEKHAGHVLVKEPDSVPFQSHDSRGFFYFHFGLKDPEGLRFEGLDLVVPIHAETQGRGLAGAVGNQGGVEVTIFSLEELGLVAGEGAPNPAKKKKFKKDPSILTNHRRVKND